MAVVSTTTVYRGLKAFSNARDHPRSLILGLGEVLPVERVQPGRAFRLAAAKWVCTMIEPIPPRFCQSDAASGDLRWVPDHDERVNPYGDPLSHDRAFFFACASRPLRRLSLLKKRRSSLRSDKVKKRQRTEGNLLTSSPTDNSHASERQPRYRVVLRGLRRRGTRR